MSALHMEKITEHSKDFHRTESLYVRAFPANERTPICGLMRHDGHDFVGFYDKDENFCGFASLLTYGGITHILYFAIDEQYREHGYGSEALKLMHTLYPKNPLHRRLGARHPYRRKRAPAPPAPRILPAQRLHPVRGTLRLAGRAVRNFSQQRHHHKHRI